MSSRQRLRALALEVGERVAGAVGCGAGGPDAIPPFGLRRRGLAEGRRSAVRLGADGTERGPCGLGLPLQFAEPILFRKPPRGRRRCLGRRDKPVPPPEIAFWGNEALANLQKRHQPLAVRAGGDADLRQATGERRRAGDAGSERLDAIGQGGVSADTGKKRPVRRRLFVGRRVEVVPERRPERRLVTAGDRDRVDDRRKFPPRHRAQKIG